MLDYYASIAEKLDGGPTGAGPSALRVAFAVAPEDTADVRMPEAAALPSIFGVTGLPDIRKALKTAIDAALTSGSPEMFVAELEDYVNKLIAGLRLDIAFAVIKYARTLIAGENDKFFGAFDRLFERVNRILKERYGGVI